MRRDARPFWMYRAFIRYQQAYAAWRVLPHLEQIGPDWRMANPWAVQVFGGGIKAGASFHVIAAGDARVRFSVWAPPGGSAELTFGDACLVTPGCRFMVGEKMTIGDGCMFAHGVTLTDCDWHGVYDRTDVHGLTKPVTLGDNVWLGDGVFVGKGVSIGDNSVIGARSVVASDIPANVVAVGNPAKVVTTFDPADIIKTRMELFADAPSLYKYFDGAYEEMLRGNSTLGWLRSKLFPNKRD